LILCDIDHFKLVNDSLGHQAGDGVLRDFAYTLRKHIRALESAFRLGGEEFLILLPGADVQRTATVAEELRVAVERRFENSKPTITASFGVAASAPDESFYFNAVYARADEGLYEAKDSGRNRVCAATGNSAAPRHSRARHQLEALALVEAA
jgi:diguanylate cyclase (GGDEF)-like protein